MSINLDRYESLIDILTYKRGANSVGELRMIQKYLLNIPNINRDDYGNFWVKVGDAPVIWSSHTDTVHSYAESNNPQNMRQKLGITDDGMIITQSASCLGADNAVGVWLMLKLHEAGVEGLYVWHREEEWGGLGSKDFVKTHKDLLKPYKIAIAFDRRKTVSVITHQGHRTCSDAFADSLIEQLGMNHIKDDGGTFTDTKSYCDLIPECTNISAGFYNEHSANEYLDIQYVGLLLDALLKVDLTKLVVERDPKSKPEWPKRISFYSGRGYGHGGTSYPYRNYDYYDNFEWEEEEELPDNEALIKKNPGLVVELLTEWGILDAFLDEIRSRE